MIKKKIGKGMSIMFDDSGMKAFEKQLLSIEPAMVDAEILALETAAHAIIDLVKSKIPSTYNALRNSIIGKIIVYRGGEKIFLTVGVGGEDAKQTDAHPMDDPIRFGRWHEHGWEPRRWEVEKPLRKLKLELKKQGMGRGKIRTTLKKELKTAWDNSGMKPGSGTTRPKHFINDSKAQARQLESQAIENAINETAEAIDSGELDRLYDPSRFGDASRMARVVDRVRSLPDQVIMVY